MASDLARRRALLTTALAALRVKQREPELDLLHRWLDTWNGLGLVVTGMNRQGYRLHLTNIDPGAWRATFSRHPMISANGFGTGRMPWHAAQAAAYNALKQVDDPPEEAPSAEDVVVL